MQARYDKLQQSDANINSNQKEFSETSFIPYKLSQSKQQPEQSRSHAKASPKVTKSPPPPFWSTMRFKAFLGLTWGAGLLVLSLMTFNIPMAFYLALMGATTLTTLFLGSDVYRSAFKSLKKKKLSMSVLYTISTLTILAVSIASIFIPGLPMMCEAAPLVLGFWHLGEEIENSFNKSLHSNLRMTDRAPKKVMLKNSRKLISVKKIKPDDGTRSWVIIVKKGSVIPVDGVLLKDTVLYTTSIDGAASARKFSAGQTVLAGMCLANTLESAEIKVTKAFKDSYLAKIDQHLKKAGNEKAPVEVMTDKILKYFVPVLLGVAVVSAVAIGILFNPALAIQCAVTVLVSACPCTLSLITPLAVKIGMSKSAAKGIHFKDGKALQAAADIDTVVFDLNGTLTIGKPTAKWSRKPIDRYMQYVKLLESKSDHAAAKAICKSIPGDYKSNANIKVSDIKSNRSGIKAIIDGKQFMIGNLKMLNENGIHKIKKPFSNPEKGSIYIVRGTEVVGQVAIEDPLRDDARQTVDALKKLGKEVHICTGSDIHTAKSYARKLGIPIENVQANCEGIQTKDSLNSKPNYIESLQKKGKKVAMVGDAANDAVAITKANFGIAIKSAISDDITKQNANAVITNSIFSVATAFDVAKNTKKVIFQNLTASLSYNSIVVLVAAGLLASIGFVLNPAIGISLMVLETSLILGNTYRLKKQEVLTANKTEALESSCCNFESTTSNISRKLNHSCCPKPMLANKKDIPHSHSEHISGNCTHDHNSYDESSDESSDDEYFDSSCGNSHGACHC